jgi:signal transduction histidine kinase
MYAYAGNTRSAWCTINWTGVEGSQPDRFGAADGAAHAGRGSRSKAGIHRETFRQDPRGEERFRPPLGVRLESDYNDAGLNSEARILIIDDEEAARYGIARALTVAGYCLAEAANGREAMELVGSFQPDVIVSDINMPELDGLSLLRQLRDRGDSMPVILVTAYGSQERVLEALRAGAYDYIAKPFEIDELRAVVRNAWERQRLAEQNRRYREAIAQSERLATLGRLVAGITHEINNPLGAMVSGVDTLDRVVRKLSSQQGESEVTAMAASAARSAREAGARIGNVVRNLKRFARIDEVEAGVTRIGESVVDTLALLRHELEGIAVETRVDESLMVSGPASEWNDVLLNLLLNARDAIYERGPQEGRIVLQVEGRDGSAVITVADNGRGIPAPDLPRIFEPGFTTKGVLVGTGLGLPICYRAVESRGGRMDVESEEGKGSRFVITVPLAVD